MTFSRSLAEKGKQEEGQQLEWDLGSNLESNFKMEGIREYLMAAKSYQRGKVKGTRENG